MFLRQAAAIAAAHGSGFPGFGQTIVSTRPRAWRTDGERRYSEIAVPPWQSATTAGTGRVEVDTSQRFQSILGFGGAFTDASCYLFSSMDEGARSQLLEELFGASGIGLSVARTCIGSSDYSRSSYSFDDSPTADFALKNFAIAHDRAYILPTLQHAYKINPQLYFFASPWSPPGWMKTGGTLLGGSMRKDYFPSYAQYFVKFLEAYKAEGIDVGAVTVQNEVDTDQNGRMPACLWGQEYEIEFVKEFLGPALRSALPETKIWLLDHNYDLWGRAIDELSDPKVHEFADGIAWHGYAGQPDAMTRVHDAFPDKNAYWTEGGPSLTDTDYLTGWARWSSQFAVILKNWARCVVAWNLVLDEKGDPNIGPFQCGGVVTVDSKTGRLTRSGQYWALAHYAKAVERDARVILSKCDVADVEHVAFANPSGTSVLILSNQGQEREIDCLCNGKSTRVQLPQNSVLTLEWS